MKLLRLFIADRLKYTGSIILGLNDALVELTGTLAGLTFALPDTKIIAIAGLISGISASMSMAGSEYLSTKEDGGKSPLKASFYTGITYIMTVILLIMPYFLFRNPLISLTLTVMLSVVIIFVFNFYISIMKNLPFKRRFLEMIAISLGVAILSFLIGLLVRYYLKINV